MTVTSGYSTLTQVKSVAQVRGAEDDETIELAINAASRMIDAYCGWRFWQDPTVVARTFEVEDEDELYFAYEPAGDGISTATGLIVKLDNDGDGVFEQTLTIGTDFVLKPFNALARYPAWPYTELVLINSVVFPSLVDDRPGVQVTAKWGFPAVPDDVTSACVLLARDLYKEMKSAPFGIADFGGDGPIRVGAHRTARMLLDPYRKASVG